MASIASSLVSGGISGIADAFTKIYSTFKMTPEQKAVLDQVASENALHMAELDNQYKIKIIDAATAQDAEAGNTIRTELQSPDPVVRRAPVAIIWAGVICMVWNYMLIQTISIWVPTAKPFNPPGWFWELVGFAIMGFAGGTAVQRALGGSGGSLSVLGITKMDSKGD